MSGDTIVRRTTLEPHPPGFADELLAELGAARVDISRIARRANKRPTRERPTPEWARWVALTAMTPRVTGVVAHEYLAELLRYLVRIDHSPPNPPAGMAKPAAQWVRRVADEIVDQAGVRA